MQSHLHVYRKRSSTSALSQYQLDHQELECVSYTSDYSITVSQYHSVTVSQYHSITVSHDLQWTKHIEAILSNTNKILGFVKRVCGRDLNDINTRKPLYYSLVRPKLEYCSNVWSPYTTKHRRLLENVQRRATESILNYPAEKSYTDRLLELRMLPLQYRRETSDLLLFFKITFGLLDFNANISLKLLLVTILVNLDPNNYCMISQHRQNYFKFSFFPRTVDIWNNLPRDFKQISSLNQFTKAISLYLDKMPMYQPP